MNSHQHESFSYFGHYAHINKPVYQIYSSSFVNFVIHLILCQPEYWAINLNLNLINSMLSCFVQITSWLQCLFIFAMVWSIGGTINGDSRKKFDAFFRLLISGTDKDHPKPNNIKMTKVK